MSGKKIKRRDFINGVLMGTASIVTSGIAFPDCANNSSGIKSGKNNQPAAFEKGDDYTLCHKIWAGENFGAPEQTNRKYDVIVIGGGMGGLSAAWELIKSGLNVVVLEKSSSVGGLCKMDNSTDVKASIASAYTGYPYNDMLLNLFKDLKIVKGHYDDGYPMISKKYLAMPPYDVHFIDGKWYNDPFTDEKNMKALPFSDQIKDDFRAFLQDMMSWYDYVGKDGLSAFDLPLDKACSTDSQVRDLDKITFLDYVKSKGWDPLVASFFDPLLTSEFGVTHDKVSAYAAICNISSDIYPDEYDLGTVSCPGGNAHIAVKLSELIGGENIETDAFVTSVKNIKGGVRVSYIKNGKHVSTIGNSAVFAAPYFMAPYLLPDLSINRKKQISKMKWAPYIIANVHVNSTPQELAWISLIHNKGIISDIIVADWAGHENPQILSPKRKNILTIYAPFTDPGVRHELLKQSIGYYEKIILTELEEILPGINNEITQFDLYRWGHPMVMATKGFMFSQERENASTPVGKIFFAGNETQGLPIIDSALIAGIEAARQINNGQPRVDPENETVR